jgi:hypothetical protein
MSALSDLTQTTGTSVTSLPDWYTTAQQNLVNQATSNAAAAPQLSQTVGQNAINTLSGPNNPFTAATGTLQNIASGAANPWITNPTTGAVTPNTNTALGGLFQAQDQQLNQLLPTTLAPTEAANIGSGNFGGLRGSTAVNTAKANALATLNTAQNQAALQNQQTGVTAAANEGNVAQQGITNAMNVGQAQMTAPFTSTANLGNILASVNAPSTVTATQTPSVLQQLTGVGTTAVGGLNALYGTSGANNLLTSLGKSIASGLGGLTGSGTDTTGVVNQPIANSVYGGSNSGNTAGYTTGSDQNTTSTAAPTVTNVTVNNDGTSTVTYSDGTTQIQ